MQKTRNGRSRPETHVRRPRRGPNCIRLYATGGPVVYKLYTIVYTREASCIQFVYNWARRARKNSRIVYKLYTILIQPDSRLQNPAWTLPPLIQFPCKFCLLLQFEVVDVATIILSLVGQGGGCYSVAIRGSRCSHHHPLLSGAGRRLFYCCNSR